MMASPEEPDGSAWSRAKLDFGDAVSFAVIADILHDSMFGMGSIEFEPVSGRFTMPLRREATELPPRRKGCLFGLLGSEEWSLVPCVLTVLNVEAVSHSDPRLRENPWILEIEYDTARGQLRFGTEPPVELVLDVPTLRGDLVDTGEPVWPSGEPVEPQEPTRGI